MKGQTLPKLFRAKISILKTYTPSQGQPSNEKADPPKTSNRRNEQAPQQPRNENQMLTEGTNPKRIQSQSNSEDEPTPRHVNQESHTPNQRNTLELHQKYTPSGPENPLPCPPTRFITSDGVSDGNSDSPPANTEGALPIFDKKFIGTEYQEIREKGRSHNPSQHLGWNSKAQKETLRLNHKAFRAATNAPSHVDRTKVKSSPLRNKQANKAATYPTRSSRNYAD